MFEVVLVSGGDRFRSFLRKCFGSLCLVVVLFYVNATDAQGPVGPTSDVVDTAIRYVI